MFLLGSPPLMFIFGCCIIRDAGMSSMSSGTEDGGGDSGMAREGDAQSQERPSKALFKEKPVKVGEEIDVTVSEVSRRGDGVARIQGFVIFIPSAKQGMQVKIRIKEIRPNFATAELIEGGPPT
jgi:predicted RNA-binding protein with TRAM domain